MALTKKQEDEILVRLEAGEGPVVIAGAMGITLDEFRVFREENRSQFRVARNGKSARLVRLNQKKNQLQTQLDALNAKIAKVAAE